MVGRLQCKEDTIKHPTYTSLTSPANLLWHVYERSKIKIFEKFNCTLVIHLEWKLIVLFCIFW